MTTYSQLQADIAAWAARDDLTAVIPSFIRLAEAWINRKVRVFQQEVSEDWEFTSPDYALEVPDGYLSLRSIINPGAAEPDCEYLPPSQFALLKNTPNDGLNAVLGSEATGYTLEGGELRVWAGIGATDPITLHVIYYERFAPLSDTNTTNYLLTNHYDLYLFACLREAWDYIDEERQVMRYQARAAGVVGDIETEESRKRMGAAPLRRRPSDAGVV